jgi:hypothetical protein
MKKLLIIFMGLVFGLTQLHAEKTRFLFPKMTIGKKQKSVI